MWRRIRIAVLLLILLFVALNTYLDRRYSTQWDRALDVVIYPINGDGSPQSERFVQQQGASDLLALEAFFEERAADHGIALDPPIHFIPGKPLIELPPMLAPDSGVLGSIAWSLRARYWAWRVSDPPPGSVTDIELFILYHDPARVSALPHSVGLSKGRFGIVHAFADRRASGSNDTVIAHELLHTLGATDKYELGTNLPRYPEGYAEPDLSPRLPQRFAELMAGRIPLSDSEADIPESLEQVVIGPQTATEIGWRKQ
jgi:hypothetical protein